MSECDENNQQEVTTGTHAPAIGVVVGTAVGVVIALAAGLPEISESFGFPAAIGLGGLAALAGGYTGGVIGTSSVPTSSPRIDESARDLDVGAGRAEMTTPDAPSNRSFRARVRRSESTRGPVQD